MRIDRIGIGILIDHHMAAHAAVTDQIVFIGGYQQVTGWDGHVTLWPDARRQQLQQFRCGKVGRVINANDGPALGTHKDHPGVTECRGLDRFRLYAFCVRPLVRIVPGRDYRMFKAGAAVIDDGAVAVEDRPTARTALHVALIRGGKMVFIDPFHRIGFTHNAGLAFGKDQCAAFIRRVDPVQVDRTGTEGGSDLPCPVHHDHVVVFLQGNDHIARRVDIDKFGFGVLGRDLCLPGQVHHLQRVAIGHTVRDIDQNQRSGGHLAHATVARILVPLVFNGDGDKAAILGHGDAVRLTAQIAAAQFFAAHHIDHTQIARRIGIAFGCVHTDKRRLPDHAD